jgi:hypothetical protein
VSHSLILALLMFVPMLTWLGLFAYLSNVDRKLRNLESTKKEQDDL